MYRYILRESCSPFDSLPLTYLTISGASASASATVALDLDKPIATLFELELALSPERSWDGTYIADFRHIVSLAEGVEGGAAGSVGESDGAAAKAAQAKATRPDAQDGTLVAFGKREVGAAFSSPAAAFLAEREWQGIEANLGGSAPSVVVDGLSGIASRYEHEASSP